MRRPGQRGSAAAPGRAWLLALFVLAFALRVLYWQATDDATWPHSAQYKGDAWVWVQQAMALDTGTLFELGLPMRPPATAYLLAALWDGGMAAMPYLRVVWLLFGALAVVGFAAAAENVLGRAGGWLVGLYCSASTGLLMLSNSLNNEALYLPLLAAALLVGERLRKRLAAEPRGATGTALAWGAVNALACLVRVEHALFFGLVSAWLYLSSTVAAVRPPYNRLWGPLLWSGTAFVLVLLPWHSTGWSAIERLNDGPAPVDAGSEQLQARHERALAFMEWETEADRARAALPAVARRPAANFVAATVAWRGGRKVTAADFAILERAFGYVPERLPTRPFVVVTGGLNFALANHAEASGGFSPALFRRPPPLADGRDAYPPAFIAGLPPRDLAFSYPPHLELVNDGYAVGWRWIREQPAAALRLAGRKLAIFWRGATLGWTGAGIPLGDGGLRRAVDLATPEGGWPTAWRLGMLGLVAVGVWRLRADPGAWLWLLYLASKVVVTVGFYGYARQGASVIPVVALLTVGAFGALDRRRAMAIRVTAMALFVTVEGARFLAHPSIAIDGRAISEADGRAPFDHEPHAITVDW